MYSTENAPVCNATNNNELPSDVDESSVPYVLWISVGRVVILALASWHILSEVGYSEITVYTSKFLLTIKAKEVYIKLQRNMCNVENRIFGNVQYRGCCSYCSRTDLQNLARFQH